MEACCEQATITSWHDRGRGGSGGPLRLRDGGRTGVTNGGFEDGTLSDAGHLGYQELPAGSSELGPLDDHRAASVDWISTYWARRLGHQEHRPRRAASPGTISQTVARPPAQTYVVTFMLAATPTARTTRPAVRPSRRSDRRDRDRDGRLHVRYDGQDTDQHGLDGQDLLVQGDRAPSTTITFTNTSAGDYGAALDQIEVDRALDRRRPARTAAGRRCWTASATRSRTRATACSFYATGRTQSRGDRQLAATARLITTALDLPQQAGAAPCPDDGRVACQPARRRRGRARSTSRRLRRIALPAEHRDGRRPEREHRPRRRRQTEPASGQDPQLVAVPEDEDVPVATAIARAMHPVGSGADLRRWSRRPATVRARSSSRDSRPGCRRSDGPRGCRSPTRGGPGR